MKKITLNDIPDVKENLINIENHIQRICDFLKGYCHTKRCKKKENCPASHFLCSLKLNLSTSIAWKAALDVSLIVTEIYFLISVLDFIMENEKLNNIHNLKSSRYMINKCIFRLQAYRGILYLHKNRYTKIILNIDSLYSTVLKIQEIIIKIDHYLKG